MWIVYFNEGSQHPDVYDYINEVFTLIRRDQVIIVTSVITRAELLELKLGPKNLRFYDDLFTRKNIVDQPVTRAITVLASNYRSHFNTLTKAGKFADAVHLATAVDNKVDEMHTTDAADLLPCNGDPMLNGTLVVRPVSTKMSLFAGVSSLSVPTGGDAKDEGAKEVAPVTEADDDKPQPVPKPAIAGLNESMPATPSPPDDDADDKKP